jgi:ATP-binding cassette, subfamily B, bacterial
LAERRRRPRCSPETLASDPARSGAFFDGSWPSTVNGVATLPFEAYMSTTHLHLPAKPATPAAPATPPAIAAAPHAGLYRNIWFYAAGARLQLFASMFLLAMSQVVKLCVPWLAAQAINALQKNGPSAPGDAAVYVALVVLTFVAAWALHGPGRVLERAVGLRIRQGHADALYAKLMRLPVAWHDRHHSGEVQQRISQSTAALYGFAQNQFVYLQSAVNLIGPLVALALFSSTLGLMAGVGYLAVGLGIMRFDRRLMALARDENAAERRYQAGLIDFLGNVSTVMSLRLHERTRALLRGRLAAIFVPLRSSIALNEIKWCAVDLFSVGLTWALVATFVGLTGRAGGAILIGSVFMVYQYAQQAGGIVGSIAGNFQGLARTRTDFASAEPIWAAADGTGAGQAVPADWTRIEISALCYDHPAAVVVPNPDHGSTAEAVAQAPAGLHHVALTLERGDRVALVGASGSGKSTLMRVLAGLYPPSQREIVVDGNALSGARHLGSIATLIPQEADVFEATIAENLTFGGVHADADIAAALHTSAFDAVMADMAFGLATPISERGFNLSGGQRQRLCLARGILAAKDSSLVMLDEPTSALDPITEEAVFTRLASNFSQACIVASVHRLSLLHHFNKVVLMEAGRVVDVGSVDELLLRQPAFRQMTGRPASPPIDALANEKAEPVLRLAWPSQRPECA